MKRGKKCKCERNDLCHQLLKRKHPRAAHYRDLMEVKDEDWAQYRWDEERPSQTAFILMGGPPCTPYSTSGRQEDLKDSRSKEMQHMVHVTELLQSPLVIIENVLKFLESDCWTVLQTSFKSIGYSLVHIERMKHSHLGGATNRKRAFVWFQKDSTILIRAFPRITRPDLFTVPQTVLRDVLNPIGHITNPPPLKSPLVWDGRINTTRLPGRPARIGQVKFGDMIEPGCRGSLAQEEGIWSILSLDSTGITKFLDTDKSRTGSRSRRRTYPINEFVLHEGGEMYPVYSTDGISTTVRASGEYPQRTTCLIWQYDGRGGEIRRLSTEEIWRIQQLPEEDLHALLIHTNSWKQQKREDALQRAAGNSIPKPMAEVVAQLTERWIWQFEKEITEVSTTTATDDEPYKDKNPMADTDDEEDYQDSETDSEQIEEELEVSNSSQDMTDAVGNVDVMTTSS